MRQLWETAGIIAVPCVMIAGSASAARLAPGPSKDPNSGKAYAGSEACSALCGKCHEAIVSNPKKHSGYRYEVASCSSCHLPHTIAAGSVPNHTFEAIAPAKTLQFGVDEKSGKANMPNACGLYCHTKESAADLDVKYKAIFKK